MVAITDPRGRIFNQQVEYEWKPQFSKKCVKFGHFCKEEETRPILQHNRKEQGQKQGRKIDQNRGGRVSKNQKEIFNGDLRESWSELSKSKEIQGRR